MATAEGGSIQTLQKHVEDMRSLVMCKICLKPFYEPYILTCGHTYCYGCLNSWFNGNVERRKNKKNCPDCRTAVKVQPAPNYLLRDLTHMFIGRIELLPEDESVEEHDRDKKEEASLLIRDRNGSGLFGGLFNSNAQRPIMPYAPIRDYEDGVIRCPECAWEVDEDGICMGCGHRLYNDSDDSLSDSIEDDIATDSDSDDESIVSDLPVPLPVQHFYGLPDSGDEDDDTHFGGPEEPDAYDVHDDFIDDDHEIDADDMDGIDGIDGYSGEPGTPYSDGTSYTAQNDDEQEAMTNQDLQNLFRSMPNIEFDSDVNEEEEEDGEQDEDEDEDEDIQPASRHRHRQTGAPTALVPAHRRRPVVISDDEDDVEEEHIPTLRTPAPLPFSENEASSDESEEDDDGSGSGSSDADGDSDLDSEPEDSSESDDTIIPPQSSRDRRQRLEAHRARRPAPSSRVMVDLVTPPRPQNQRNHSRSRGSNAVGGARRSRVSVH